MVHVRSGILLCAGAKEPIDSAQSMLAARTCWESCVRRDPIHDSKNPTSIAWTIGEQSVPSF